MKTRFENDLLLVSILAVVLVALIAQMPTSLLRVVFGVILALFSPGYALLAALFPKKSAITIEERLGLSVMVSLVVAVGFGYLSNYAPWGIRLYPIVIFLAAVVVVCSAIAWLRRRRLPPEERLAFNLDIPIPRWGSLGAVEKALSLLLAVAVLVTLGSIGYVLAVPGPVETFTEFYLLGPKGKIGDYPLELALKKAGEVTVVIVNHEQAPVDYRLEIAIDGKKDREITPISLASGQKWQELVGFTPSRSGPGQRVDFILYKEGEAQPYRRLFLFVNVGPGS